jgi:pyruvate/2-oxoglutarate dehydrogenase complex dihydrolipoamide acyltransferase (E2) component
MAANIIMPQLGETVAEGKIVSWFKKRGDLVKPGDRLFEVETDKVTIDVEAIESGTISEIKVGDGASAAVGAVVAVLDGAAATTHKAPEEKPVPASSAPVVAPVLTPHEEVPTARGLFGKAAIDGLRVTPLARRVIAVEGMDLRSIVSEARRKGLERITEKDVRALGPSAAAATPRAEPAPARPPASAMTVQITAGQGDEIVPFSTIRQKTADRLAENWRTIPHVFQALEVDFTGIDTVRKARKDSFKVENGLSLTYLPFIARAVAIALKEFPDINARTDGTRLIRSRSVHLGIAVDLDHKGLVVPVLKHADELNVGGIAKGIGRLVEKARSGKLSADDMAGGTYSITNNGAFGNQFTAPIINAPQVAILSTDAIRMRPAVVSTPAGDFIAPRLLGTVGQSFDHRAFDGAYAAAYLSRLKVILETRSWGDEFA